MYLINIQRMFEVQNQIFGKNLIILFHEELANLYKKYVMFKYFPNN